MPRGDTGPEPGFGCTQPHPACVRGQLGMTDGAMAAGGDCRVSKQGADLLSLARSDTSETSLRLAASVVSSMF